jgi:nickel/cobalt transporter (NicO) family protein
MTKTFAPLCQTVSFGMLVLGIAALASAHPLGNFSVNRYSRIEPGPERLQIHYVVNMAEVPALQERGRIDADRDGAISDQERDRYVQAMAAELPDRLHLTLNGQAAELQIVSADLSFPEGDGGMFTHRLTLVLQTPLPPIEAGEVWQATYRDDTYSERLGWQEIVVRPGPDINVLHSTAPQQDQSDALRAYPAEQMDTPLQVEQAQFTFAPGRAAAATPVPPREQQAEAAGGESSDDRFTRLITQDMLSSSVVAAALLIAMGLGAIHALSPGHGKSIVAAYLIGSRGTARHAVFLGLVVTITHTIGVFALGLITLFASQYILPEQLYPWLGAISGLIVVVIGVTLLVKRVRGATAHHHHHNHEHQHEHDPDHGHSHLPPGADGTPVTWRSLLALGISGGLLPCPTALVVLLSAISLHRVGFGLVLIAAFSIGLATVLTAIGLLFVKSRRVLDRLPFASPVLRRLPAGSALLITLLGLIIMIRTVFQILAL